MPLNMNPNAAIGVQNLQNVDQNAPAKDLAQQPVAPVAVDVMAPVSRPPASLTTMPAPPAQLKPARTPADVKALVDAALPGSQIGAVVASDTRFSALMQLDMNGQKSAFDYIMELAQSPPTKNMPDPKVLAKELISVAGNGQNASHGRCYGRTLYAVWTRHHFGEFARLMSEMARGPVKLQNGQTVVWDRDKAPCNYGSITDWMFGTLVVNVRKRDMPDNHVLDTTTDRAHGGEMANIYYRLKGIPHVNVDFAPPNGPAPDPQIAGQIVREYGPSLAEYILGSIARNVGGHGGSLTNVTPQNIPSSLEPEGVVQTPPQQAKLGYVVMPLEAAKKFGLTVMPIAKPENNYCDAILKEIPT